MIEDVTPSMVKLNDYSKHSKVQSFSDTYYSFMDSGKKGNKHRMT